MLRHVCKRRLKMEVEYGLKRGTTDNSYLTQVRNNALIVISRLARSVVGPSATSCDTYLLEVHSNVLRRTDDMFVPALCPRYHA